MFLYDFSNFSEKDNDQDNLLKPASSILAGGAIGTIGVNSLLKRKQKNKKDKASSLLERMNKIEKISRDTSNNIRPKTRIKMDRKADKLFDNAKQLLLDVDNITKNKVRNIRLGALGGAALGYGTYRAAKSLLNRKKEGKK